MHKDLEEMKKIAPAISVDDVQKGLDGLIGKLFHPDQGIEIRVIKEYWGKATKKRPEGFRSFAERHFHTLSDALENGAKHFAAWNSEPGVNIYFGVNSRKTIVADDGSPGVVETDKSRNKLHIESVVSLHVDLDDILPDEAKTLASEIGVEMIWVGSGSGSHGYLLLDSPIAINTPADVAFAENLIRRLMICFGQKVADKGADSTQDITRILRIPGLVNWPDERKREKGRKPSLCYLAYSTDKRYLIEELNEKLPQLPEKMKAVFNDSMSVRELTKTDSADAVFEGSFSSTKQPNNQITISTEYAEALLEKTDLPERFKRMKAYVKGIIKKASSFWSKQSERGTRAKKLVYTAWMFGIPINEMIDWAVKNGASINEPEYWKQYQDRYLKTNNPFGFGLQPQKASPAVLAELFLLNRGYGKSGLDCKLRYWRGDFYRWEESHYELVLNKDLESGIVQFLQRCKGERDFVTKSKVNNILINLQGLCYLADFSEPPFLIEENIQKHIPNTMVMKNGTVEVEKLLEGHCKVTPHNSRVFSLSQLPYAFSEEAKCIKWISFLEQMLPDPEIRNLVQEWFGYNLIFDTSFHKFVITQGEGANGKSVVCCVLKALLGESSYSAVGLEAFNPTRTFPLAAMVGKLANIVEEIGEIDKTAEGVIKGFVAGNATTVERKFKDPFNMNPTARLTFSTNVLPRFTDRSNGIWRRLLLIPFRVQLKENEQDKRLATSTFWNKSGELPGIFNWAIAGLKRLQERGYFLEPKACISVKEIFKRDNNPARSFLTECCISNSSGMIPSKELYQSYKEYVDELGQRPLGAPQFTKEVARIFPGAVLSPNALRLPGGNRGRVWTGISMRDASSLQDSLEYINKLKNEEPKEPDDDLDIFG